MKVFSGAKRSIVLLAGGALLLALTLSGLSSCTRQPVRIARMTILISGNTMGFLENCGCARGQTGGMHRRARLIKQEIESAHKVLPTDKARASETIVIDTGDFSERGKEEFRLRTTGVVRAMGIIGYDAVGLGSQELEHPQDELLKILKLADLPYITANLTFTAPREGEDRSRELTELVAPYKVITLASGFRVGVIHVIDHTNMHKNQDIADGYHLGDAAHAAAKILAAHAGEADYWLLSAGSVLHRGLDPASIARLGELTMVTGFRQRNPREGQRSTEVMFPYFVDRPLDKGKDVTRVVNYFQAEGKIVINAEKLGVQDHIKGDPEVVALINELLPALEEIETKEAEKKLEEQKLSKYRPLYVGYNSCISCHAAEAELLKDSKHVHAYETLVKEGKHKTSCAKCHVVGYNKPNRGWDKITDAKMGGEWELRGVQCEVCHGPAEYHVKLMQSFAGGDRFVRPENFLADGRNASGLVPVKANSQVCIACHDPENSPQFSFEEYWAKIEH